MLPDISADLKTAAPDTYTTPPEYVIDDEVETEYVDYFEQLLQWGLDFHSVSLTKYADGWVCSVSTSDPMRPHVPDPKSVQLQAASAACTTPEEAIESLLEVVQP